MLLIAVAVLSLPVVYVVSAGPLNWLMLHGFINEQSATWRCIVAHFLPLEWIINDGGPLGEWIRRYLDLWIE
jgi:hypothetical protein